LWVEEVKKVRHLAEEQRVRMLERDARSDQNSEISLSDFLSFVDAV
jgi:hypothetical protein